MIKHNMVVIRRDNVTINTVSATLLENKRWLMDVVGGWTSQRYILMRAPANIDIQVGDDVIKSNMERWIVSSVDSHWPYTIVNLEGNC